MPILRRVAAALACILTLAPPQAAEAVAERGPRLAALWPHLQADREIVVWVDFIDKSRGAPAKPAEALVTARSLRRRAKVRPATALVDEQDQPLAVLDLQELAGRVVRIRQCSKWLASASVVATRRQIEALQVWPRVRRLELVAGCEPVPAARRAVPPPVSQPPAPRPAAPPPPGSSRIDYGNSLVPLEQLNIPDVHARGITGGGVVVAHFDDGYALLSHEVFATMQRVAVWDFIGNDADPAPRPTESPFTGQHGMGTLSVLAGYRPGRLVGSAYGASFILARTERTDVELPSEEDRWIAALEWADSLGADIVSSSLRFFDYPTPYRSYTWLDMNGRTARVTRAADLAEERGILVVNGAGNAGNALHNTLVAPADGVHVLAVGAVNARGQRAGFSSVGPTTDIPQRIKPDVMGPGVHIWSADFLGTETYTELDGTSLSCPLVAGIAALLLSAYPNATPADLRNALRYSASHAGEPTNQMGWGLVDAAAALYWLGNTPTGDAAPATRFHLAPAAPNPFNPTTTIRWGLEVAARVQLVIHDARGRTVRRLVSGHLPARVHDVVWDGRDDRGRPVASGVYVVQLRADGGRPGHERSFTMQRKLALVR
jgi:subtilisin family serine protease